MILEKRKRETCNMDGSCFATKLFMKKFKSFYIIFENFVNFDLSSAHACEQKCLPSTDRRFCMLCFKAKKILNQHEAWLYLYQCISQGESKYMKTFKRLYFIFLGILWTFEFWPVVCSRLSRGIKCLPSTARRFCMLSLSLSPLSFVESLSVVQWLSMAKSAADVFVPLYDW